LWEKRYKIETAPVKGRCFVARLPVGQAKKERRRADARRRLLKTIAQPDPWD